MNEMEIRFVSREQAELRVEGDEAKTLHGIAPPYNTLSVDLGGFREQFAPGAFGESTTGDVVSTVEHNNAKVIGRTPKTLRFNDGDDGLRYEVDLPETTAAADLVESVQRGDVRGSSFEFRVKAGGQVWEEDDDGTVTRTITAAELFQVGPVTKPAYPDGNSVALRSMEEWKAERDVEPESERVAASRRRRLALAETD